MYRKLARVPRGLRAKQVTTSISACALCPGHAMQRRVFRRGKRDRHGVFQTITVISARVCHTCNRVLANAGTLTQKGGRIYMS